MRSHAGNKNAVAARGVAECRLPDNQRRCPMAEPRDNGLVGSVENLLAEKEAVAAKEKKLIENLNAALGKMGYRVVSAKGGAHSAGAGSGKKLGRPPGSGKGQTSKGAAAP